MSPGWGALPGVASLPLRPSPPPPLPSCAALAGAGHVLSWCWFLASCREQQLHRGPRIGDPGARRSRVQSTLGPEGEGPSPGVWQGGAGENVNGRLGPSAMAVGFGTCGRSGRSRGLPAPPGSSRLRCARQAPQLCLCSSGAGSGDRALHRGLTAEADHQTWRGGPDGQEA